mmetsp:Transcript_36576/g.95755  ORF Transcript_36576/g.95755 Transcript_36576/m.95755 type:complete len:202 (-) Transcript_36576:1023-1628(-)
MASLVAAAAVAYCPAVASSFRTLASSDPIISTRYSSALAATFKPPWPPLAQSALWTTVNSPVAWSIRPRQFETPSLKPDHTLLAHADSLPSSATLHVPISAHRWYVSDEPLKLTGGPAYGSIPSACWLSYSVISAFFDASTSPVVASAVRTLTPMSPGQITRSRLAPSTSTTSPTPQTASLFQPTFGAGHCRPCFEPIEQS